VTPPVHDYNKHRDYRCRVVEYQKSVGMTSFTENNQFWTLGGPQHHEFTYLNNYFDFAPRSYHTVDRSHMAATEHLDNSVAVVAYPNTEFKNIYRFWKDGVRVGAISYDSTETILPRYGFDYDQSFKLQKITDLVDLALLGTDNLMVHMNWMIGWANYSDPVKNLPKVEEEYGRWVNRFVGRYCREYDVTAFDGSLELMEGSLTYMVGMHFHLCR